MSPVMQYVFDGKKWQNEVTTERSSVAAAAASTLPTGPGYVRYEDLYRPGDTLQQTFNRLTVAAIITMPPGVFETKVQWGKAPLVSGSVPSDAALRLPKICRGIWGSGKGALGSTAGTVIRVTPNTCRSKSEGGSWFQGGGSGSGSFTLKNVHFEGTDQGRQTVKESRPGLDGTSPKLFTNVFLYNYGGAVLVEDVLVTGWYGNNGAPPGETFGLQIYGCHNHVMRRVEADGRREPGGLAYGAVGLTSGSCVGSVWYDCWSHHSNAKTYAMVFFQNFNCKTYNCRLGSESDGADGYGEFGYNGGGFNQERVAGAEHHNMKIYMNRKVGDKGVHFNHSSDSWGATYQGVARNCVNGTTKIIDATWNSIWGKTGNPMFVSTWIPYGGNANEINISPEVIKAGKNVPFQWIYGGKHLTVTGPYRVT
jgi:hypothetical protein